MKKIHIKYFAVLKEERGLDDEVVETERNTAQELYEDLQKQYGFTMTTRLMRVSINKTFAPWETEIQDGDELVFIPPVAGG